MTHHLRRAIRFESDLVIRGQQYSCAVSLFYFGHLVREFPARERAVAVERLRSNRMGIKTTWLKWDPAAETPR